MNFCLLLPNPLTLALLTPSLSSHQKEPPGASKITCRSVTPSHLGEKKAGPKPIVPTEGNKSKLSTPGQSRKQSLRDLTQPTSGTVSRDTQWLCASLYLAPAGVTPGPLPNSLQCPGPCPQSHGPVTTHTFKKAPKRDRLGGALPDTSLFLLF